MILVVALNPALDVTHEVDLVDWAGVNRPRAVHVRPGGKGVNVARTLRALGADVTLAGLVGGGVGRELVTGLSESGISIALTQIAAETRRTFTVVDAGRNEAAVFNEPGPPVSAGEYQEFFVGYEKALIGCAAVVLAGSLPPGLAAGTYADLIAAAAAASVPAILDASGSALGYGAAAGPALVKPNLAELEAAVGRSLRSGDDPELTAVQHAAGELVALGAGAAVVSLGPHGLLAVGPAGTWLARPRMPVQGNPTGAGDAVVAGLADGLVRDRPWPERLRHAVALGAATVAAPTAGEFSADDYQRHLAQVQVTGLPAKDAAQSEGPAPAGTDARQGDG